MSIFDIIKDLIKKILKKKDMDVSLENNPQGPETSGIITENTSTVKLTGRGTVTSPLKASLLSPTGSEFISTFNNRFGPAILPQTGDYTWAMISNKPTTIVDAGLTDAVSTVSSYSNPSWITGLAWSKISGTPTSISGYNIADGVSLTGAQTLTNKILTSPQFNFGSDADGDLVVRQGGVYARLAVGGNGQVLKIIGGLPAWGTDLTGGGGGGGTINTVFGRSGPDITAQAGDYSFGQISGTPTTLVGYGITDGISLTGIQTLTNKTLTAPILTSPVINLASNATGDIYYRNGSGAFTRLPIGTEGYKLTVASGLPAWGTPSTDFTAITISGLRTAPTTSTNTPYYITDTGKEGFYYYDATDVVSADNMGTILVNTATSRRFKRSFSGTIQLSWFGMIPNDNSGGAATANVAAINAALAVANSDQLVIASGGGTWYLNSTVTMFSTLTKRVRFKIEGNVTFITLVTEGFILYNNFPLTFEITGIYSGANTGGNNTAESTWTGYIGRGIYLKNIYNSEITVNEIQNFRVGIEMVGESGTTPLGSQYNKVRFSWLHHNYIQIKIATYGNPGSSGNWCNENNWYGGQLGRGIPTVSYGNGGWIGLLFEKDVTSITPYYGMSGHNFYDFNFEGLEKGIVASNTANNTFIGVSFEPEGMHQHINLSTDSLNPVVGIKFEGGTLIEDRYFVAGGEGLSTLVDGIAIWGKVGASSVPIGYQATSVNVNPAMVGPNIPTAGSLIISSDTFQGFSALNSLDDTSHTMWSKLSQYPNTRNGVIKFGGAQRHGAYKSTYSNIIAGSAALIDLPANIGYIRFAADENTTARIHAGDLSSVDFEAFEVEMTTAAFTLTITSAIDDSVIFASATFPAIGKYRCVYRSSGWTSWRTDGAGGSGSFGNVDAVGTANATGVSVSGGITYLRSATINQPGVLTASGSQTIGGRKIWTATLTTSPYNAFVVNPTMTADADNALMIGLDVLPTYNSGGFSGTRNIGVRTNSIRIQETGLATNDIAPVANGINIQPVTTLSSSYYLYAISSFYNTKDVYLLLGKSGVTTGGLANDGTDIVLVGEKNTAGFILRNNAGLVSIDFAPGTVTGQNLLKVFSDGNMIIKSQAASSAYVNNGYKLEVDGKIRANVGLVVQSQAADPGSPEDGLIAYNSTLGKFRGRQAGAWVNIADGVGGGGGGDAFTNTAISVVNEIGLFADTTGKLFKRSTGTGYAKLIVGVLSVQTGVPTGDITGITGTPDGTKYLRDDFTWQTVAGGGGGITAFVTPINATSALGGDVSGGNPRLFYATATNPGIIANAAQTLPGDKTFNGMVTFKQGTTGGSVQARFNSTSQLRSAVDTAGAVEYDSVAGDVWVTDNALQRTKVLRTDSVAILGNGFNYQGAPIEPGYGGNGANTTITQPAQNYTVVDSVGTVICTYAGAGTQTITLPAATGRANKRITVIARATGKTVAISNGDSLGGNTTAVPPSAITYVSDNTVWFIVSRF